ncbi:AraC-like ligand-binding domain-containing protein [Streptomyces galbus]|nr:helix-turn-helix domain-containing protein [Streptomyces galbus]
MTQRMGSGLPATRSFEAFTSARCAPLQVVGPDPQECGAVVDQATVGPLVVVRIRATAATVTRDSSRITSSDMEWVHVNLVHRGLVTAIQDDRATTVRPGELFTCDSTRPYRLVGAVPSDFTVLCVPRAVLGRHGDTISRRTALSVPAQGAIGRLLDQALSAVDADLPRDSAARMHLADALTALLLGAFADTACARPPVASDLVERIRAHVLAHLDDPRLNAERTARRHNISVRHLHALFKESDLTFAAWVRHERLRRIRRDLLDPAFADVSTAAVAARWGVHDTKHLGRALRSEFGETVSDLRRPRP